MHKSTMLFVVSILLIVFGGFAAIGSLLLIFGGSVLGAAGISGGGVFGGLIAITGIILLVGAALNIVAGILGIKNHKSPEKAKICVNIGIIMISLQLVSFVFGEGFNISALIGFVLPVLYYIGALQLKKMQ